jgi:hypothetical protein
MRLHSLRRPARPFLLLAATLVCFQPTFGSWIWIETQPGGNSLQEYAWEHVSPSGEPLTATQSMLGGATGDVDNDGLDSDGEHAAGADPYAYDTDLDGLRDGDEVHLTATSPVNWDSDEPIPKGQRRNAG